ncbi:Alkaline phosphatase synthesis sensor protein PhoR [Parageobacillus caldoxylosilyticus]|nr:Alkaline phosphatase synthesis sensor protein PhoR [Parageobacillus caldoxylosilyticus]BDG34270.1 two-component sensor histidine kinase [Parageobacillus caldoxylosilyticus]BDG38038.1 two-component sensor histidine kinase [Parageobacillus caldoxylosilyticus]BDG41810.1 two-component sensor histidine kinase [Parageobacillus caldoxylosilyticus]
MSIRTKLLLSYIGMVLIPIVLFILSVMMLIGIFLDDIKGINEYYKDDQQKKWVFSFIETFKKRDEIFSGIKMVSRYDPERLMDHTFLQNVDKELRTNNSGLLITKQNKTVFASAFLKDVDLSKELLRKDTERWEMWKREKDRFFVIQTHDFHFQDGSVGTVYLFTDTSPLAHFMEKFFPLVILSLLLVIGLTNGLLTFFVSRSIIKPIYSLKHAAEQIKEGNLNYEVNMKRKDEIGELSEAFEEMRCRLKESIQLQLQYEENRKELLANISHDLKTPITGIKGCVEAVMDGIADTKEKLDKYMNMIYKKADDMDRLIDDLFLFSKLDLKRVPFHFENIDIVDYLTDCVDELRYDPNLNGVKMNFLYDGKEPVTVVADREQLRRVIMNIVDNSIKYKRDKTLEIGFDLIVGEKDVTIAICDNGPGIEREALQRIFERFYRAEKSRNTETGGSGLGLAIVKQIIEEHGGKVWAESQAGKGTTIYFTLQKSKVMK